MIANNPPRPPLLPEWLNVAMQAGVGCLLLGLHFEPLKAFTYQEWFFWHGLAFFALAAGTAIHAKLPH